MLEHFHFLHPLWLLALIPLGLLLWLARNPGGGGNSWRGVVDDHLLPLLMQGQKNGKTARLPLVLLACGWLLAVAALADPVWEKLPQPVFQSNKARVVVLDLSRSMNTPDLKPSRLTRARFKADDILNWDDGGQTGLVAFAGDAFVVSPLTRDGDTIKAMLKVLTPDLMPVQGSRADLGLRKAGELLEQAGLRRGDILLIGDGSDGGAAVAAARELHAQGYNVSVLGLGTKKGAPLPDGHGGFVRDASGRVVIPRLNTGALRLLAKAGGGRYATVASNDADLNVLLSSALSGDDVGAAAAGLKTEAWKQQGPVLVLLLLPLAALAFRRGWLLSLALLAVIGTAPRPAVAFSWTDLWQRQDQQADQALRAGDLSRASELAVDPVRRGTAEYRQGNYQAALKAFSGVKSADAAYNRGNALARLGRYQEAVAAYDRVLKQNSGMQDALHNKKAVEELLRKQRQRRKQQTQSQNSQQQQANGQGKQQSGNKGGGRRQQGAQSQGNNGQGASQNRAAEKPRPNAGQGARSAPAGNTSGSPDKARKARTGTKDTQSVAHRKQQPDQAGQANTATVQKEEQKQDAAAPSAPSGQQPLEKKGNQFARAAQQAGRKSTEPARTESTAASRRASGQKPSMVPPTPAAAGRQAQSGPAGDNKAQALTSEEKLAAEQWLRRIPDDPGGLLRRKFLYQYQQRPARAGTGSGQAW